MFKNLMDLKMLSKYNIPKKDNTIQMYLLHLVGVKVL
jgi:hypothetical protein